MWILSNTLLQCNPGPPTQPFIDGVPHLKGHCLADVTHKSSTKIHKYNLTTVSQPTIPSFFLNCIGTFTSRLPLWERCCPDPFTMEPITFLLAHTQLHREAPVRSLQSNPQPFNDRKLSGSLSSTPLRCVFAVRACVCTDTHQHS